MVTTTHPDFELKWNHVAFRPYLLNPELDGLPPVPKVEHLEKKLGKPLTSMQDLAQLKEDGIAYGLNYRFEETDLSSGTIDSHRLMTYAATEGGAEVAMACRQELMRLYNEEGQALAGSEVLLGVAEKVGLDVDVAEAVLDGGAYTMDVKWMDKQARKQGIDSVPYYRFYTPQGTHIVSDCFDEWRFMDGIYRAFPGGSADANWQSAGSAAREVVTALDRWRELERRLVEDEEEDEEATVEQVRQAEERVRELKARYSSTVLPAEVETS